jgi:hypothetical protein
MLQNFYFSLIDTEAQDRHAKVQGTVSEHESVSGDDLAAPRSHHEGSSWVKKVASEQDP